jgi:uncharacterized protein YdaU (DUF1376 family)
VNYYPFHIGDYSTHTAHLEPMEDLAYRRLLDLYYLREGPLPPDIGECARLVRLRSHIEVVEAVLKEFFLEYPTGWINERCDHEIARMVEKKTKASASGKASAAARSTNVQRTFNDRSTDVQLPIPTPTPIPKSSSTKKRGSADAKPVDVSDEVWGSFMTVRKAKKAAVTDLAILGIRREAVKAGITLEQALTTCCERGWAGFKADWYSRDAQPHFNNPADAARTTVPGSKERDPALVKIEADRKNAAPPPAEVKAKMAELLGRMKA